MRGKVVLWDFPVCYLGGGGCLVWFGFAFLRGGVSSLRDFFFSVL